MLIKLTKAHQSTVGEYLQGLVLATDLVQKGSQMQSEDVEWLILCLESSLGYEMMCSYGSGLQCFAGGGTQGHTPVAQGPLDTYPQRRIRNCSWS